MKKSLSLFLGAIFLLSACNEKKSPSFRGTGAVVVGNPILYTSDAGFAFRYSDQLNLTTSENGRSVRIDNAKLADMDQDKVSSFEFEAVQVPADKEKRISTVSDLERLARDQHPGLEFQFQNNLENGAKAFISKRRLDSLGSIGLDRYVLLLDSTVLRLSMMAFTLGNGLNLIAPIATGIHFASGSRNSFAEGSEGSSKSVENNDIPQPNKTVSKPEISSEVNPDSPTGPELAVSPTTTLNIEFPLMGTFTLPVSVPAFNRTSGVGLMTPAAQKGTDFEVQNLGGAEKEVPFGIFKNEESGVYEIRAHRWWVDIEGQSVTEPMVIAQISFEVGAKSFRLELPNELSETYTLTSDDNEEGEETNIPRIVVTPEKLNAK